MCCYFIAIKPAFADNNDDLWQAIKNKDIQQLQEVISTGVELEPDCSNDQPICTPLSLAVQSSSTEIVEMLIATGVDVNGKKNSFENSALIIAILELVKEDNGNPEISEIITTLLKNKADVNQPNSFGISPFLASCRMKDDKYFKLFSQYGGDINAAYDNKVNRAIPSFITPLMAAAGAGNVTIVEYLLNNGVDVNAKNSFGESALEFTQNAQYQLQLIPLEDQEHSGLDRLLNIYPKIIELLTNAQSKKE